MDPSCSSAPSSLKPSDSQYLQQEIEQPSRRSANYAPTLWTDDKIQSLTSKTIKEEEEESAGRWTSLKEEVKQFFQTRKEVDQQLQLIDNLQQLGVAYHFKDDIKSALSALCTATLEDAWTGLSDNLHATALLFRLLREYGFSISDDVFNKFKDEEGLFKASLLNHTGGILSLYEACYLATEGEAVLDQALAFATQHLKSLMESSVLEPCWRELVAHALELPRVWRMERIQTRWFIEASERHATVNPLLLEFAKLDFNRVQGIYQRELNQLSRWWTNLGLAEKLPFSRDRLVESYFFSVGWQFEPQFGTLRDAQTKQNCLLTIIDDAYDVYGTLNELQLFTNAVERWDVSTIDELPEYLKIIFLALFNFVNDVAFKVLRDKGLDVIPHLKRACKDLCKAYLVEAQWYHSCYKPKLAEYLENAFISISIPMASTLAYCISEDLTKEHLEQLNNNNCPAIMRWSSLIIRLLDDLSTSSDELQRGDAPKSIQCYMYENNATTNAACEHVKGMIYKCWKAINGDRVFTCCFEENLKRLAINVPGVAHCMYGMEDNFGKPGQAIKHIIISAVFDPIVF